MKVLWDSEKVIKDYPNSRKVTTDTFFLGTSPVITDEHLDYIESTLDDFLTKKRIHLPIMNSTL
jgi:dTDP-4-amino-4,6-dideoxygalactose transaminase